jgi:hypothetical protein
MFVFPMHDMPWRGKLGRILAAVIAIRGADILEGCA